MNGQSQMAAGTPGVHTGTVECPEALTGPHLRVLWRRAATYRKYVLAVGSEACRRSSCYVDDGGYQCGMSQLGSWVCHSA